MKRIKVVFLIQQLVCGGAEQALYDLVCLMDKTKFDISILVLVGGGAWEEKFRSTGIPVINIFYRRQKGCSLSQFAAHQLRKMRIHLINFQDSRKLVGMFLPDGADIAVSYSMWGDEAAALAYGMKHIKFVHGNVENNAGFRKLIMDNLEVLPEYHRIVCVSEESCCSFRRTTGITDTVRMHYNPLNSGNVCRMAQEPVWLPQDVPLLCAVGRLVPEKAYDRLIRIHRHILDQGIPHRLVIVGDGPEQGNLMQVIQETGTNETVMMAGYQSNPYPYIKASRFLVCSSYTEGLPVIAMEALTLGVPIVSSVPSIGEIFGDSMCGIITENDNASLEAGIKKMLCDGVFYSTAKQGAQARSSFFDGKRMVKEIEEMFVEVMKEK